MIERNGYLMQYVGRQGSTGSPYRYVHRLVMEAHLGRPLESHEIVHHINHDKHDNRLENLRLLDGHGAHIREHVADGTWGGRGTPRPSLQKPKVPCPVCGEPFKPKRRDRQDTKTCSYACSNRLRPRGICEGAA